MWRFIYTELRLKCKLSENVSIILLLFCKHWYFLHKMPIQFSWCCISCCTWGKLWLILQFFILCEYYFRQLTSWTIVMLYVLFSTGCRNRFTVKHPSNPVIMQSHKRIYYYLRICPTLWQWSKTRREKKKMPMLYI